MGLFDAFNDENDPVKNEFKALFGIKYDPTAAKTALLTIVTVFRESGIRITPPQGAKDIEQAVAAMRDSDIKANLGQTMHVLWTGHPDIQAKVVKRTHAELMRLMKEEKRKSAAENPDEYTVSYWNKKRFRDEVGEEIEYNEQNIRALIREKFEQKSGITYTEENMKTYFAEGKPTQNKGPGKTFG